MNAHSSISVVLADDHAIVREGLRMILQSERDIRVVGDACHGREAVRAVRQFEPDVVVMDISMPELDGIEAIRQIRETRVPAQVVVLSMHAMAEYVYQAMRAGALGYVLKESAGTEVVRAVRAVHKGQRFLSDKIAEIIAEDYVARGESRNNEDRLAKLSSREREIMRHVVEGRSSTGIAKDLFLSPKTVETYRSRMMQKLGVKNLAELIKFVVANEKSVKKAQLIDTASHAPASRAQQPKMACK